MMDGGKLTERRKRELRAVLVSMGEASTGFYLAAARSGHHQFLEFTGLLNEYINLCREALEDGRDFQNSPLEAKTYHLDYIAEKLDCIYGDTIKPLAGRLGKR